MKRIYLDFAASTPVDKRVLSAMDPYWRGVGEKDGVGLWGNASAVHAEGRYAHSAVEEVRKSIATHISAKKEEIIFTSGGTEGNNLAIFGIVNNLVYHKGIPLYDIHLVTSAIEHPSVLDCFQVLAERGADVTYISVDEHGITNPEDIRDALKDNTALVSIAYANNEIGTIQPVSKIARIVHEHRKRSHFPLPTSDFQFPYFHTDASQAPLFLNCHAGALGIDLMTIDAQKLYGPKGVGFLYKRESVALDPLFRGGTQERSVRPGTLPTPLIVGLGEAYGIASSEREEMSERVTKLRDYFIDALLEHIPAVELNGDRVHRLPNNVNVSISDVDAEFLVVVLDKEGVSAATKSACLSQSEEKSYVIEALGKSGGSARSSIRFSLGKTTTKEELDRVVDVLKDTVGRLRERSQ